jgi:hypothetical protein
MHAADAGIWAHAERCRRAIVRAAEQVVAAGGQLIAIKGVHLAFGIAEGPWARPMTDADGVVCDVSFAAVLPFLRRASFEPVPSTTGTLVVLSPEGVLVDLHARPLPRGLGLLDAKTLQARALPAPFLSPNLRVPSPLDAIAIAIGHWAKDACGAESGIDALARDLTMLQRHAAIGPEVIAAHLDPLGLRRAGAFASVALASASPSFASFADVFVPDLAERLRIAAWTRRLQRLGRGRFPQAGLVLSRAIADDALSAARGVAFGAVQMAHDYVQAKRRRLHVWSSQGDA